MKNEAELLEAIQEVTYREFKGTRKVKRPPDYFSIAYYPSRMREQVRLNVK
jgi:hypothetical protein